MIPLLLAQLCITDFYLGRDQSQIRIKNEVGTFKHVEAFQYFFYWQFQGGTVQFLLILLLIYVSCLFS